LKKKKGNAEKKEAAPVQKKQSKNEPKTQETPSAPVPKGKNAKKQAEAPPKKQEAAKP